MALSVVHRIQQAFRQSDFDTALNTLLIRLSGEDALGFAKQVIEHDLIVPLVMPIISPSAYDSLIRQKAIDVVERVAGLHNKECTDILIAFELHTALIKILEPQGSVSHHAVMALTKMIHFPEHRDQLIERGLVSSLCRCCDGKHGMEAYHVMEAVTDALYKMCIGAPFIGGDVVLQIVPTLISCTHSKSPKIIVTALEALTAILAVNPNTERIMLLIDHGLTARLAELLYHINTEVSGAALNALRFLSLGEENVKYVLHHKGMFSPLQHHLNSRTPYVRSTVLDTIANLARYSPRQVTNIITIPGLADKLLRLQSTDTIGVRVDAARCLFTILESAHDNQTHILIQGGLIPLLARALVEFIDNPEGLIVTIQSARMVVGARDEIDQRNARQFKYYEGMENLRRLRQHKDQRVAVAAASLVEDIE